MARQRTEQPFIAHGGGFTPWQDHDIKSNVVSSITMPEAFSDHPFNPVAAYRALVDLAGNRHAQSRVVRLVYPGKDLEKTVRRNERFFENLFKFNRFCKFLVSGK